MANKTVFTAFDVYNFKKALAQHSAKWNVLHKKYSDLLAFWEKERFTESHTDFSNESKDLQIRTLQQVLSDIDTPYDLFVSQFEMTGSK